MTSAIPPRAPVVVSLPWPPSTLSPNYRPKTGTANGKGYRWSDRTEDTEAYRYACKILGLKVRRQLEALGHEFPLRGPVRQTFTFVLTDKRRHDFINLYGSCKAGEDGIVDSGLIKDDSVWDVRPVLEVELGNVRLVRLTLEGAAE